MAKARVIAIGDELLLGIRDNSNLTYLGGELSRLGITLDQAVEVRDDVESIADAVRDAIARADLVLITGGLGPTVDDLTRDGVAQALGRQLHEESQVIDQMRERFARMGREMAASNLRQAQIIDEAEALENHFGTAPGQFINVDGKFLVLLPGPQLELRPMWEQEVVPRLTRADLATSTDSFVQLRTFGLAESLAEETLQPVVERHPGLDLAFCAHSGIVDIRLSGLAKDDLHHAALEARELLGEDFFAEGFGSPAKLVLERLRVMNRSLAVAESCTGGLLADAFTNIPGASKVFHGGIVCYSNDVKIEMLDVPESILQQHGAVSAECAVAMATGAAERFSSHYALAVTGFAGPGGGTPDNPVGTIYLGYCSPIGAWSRKVVYPGQRLAIKERAVNTALDWIRRKTAKYMMQDLLATYPEESAAGA